MDLKTYQLRIKQMLKGEWQPAPGKDAYFNELYHSKNLAIVKEIALWWRAFQMEQNCPLASGYLKRCDTFDAAIEAFYARHNVSPYVEKAAGQFLTFLSGWTDDRATKTLAEFELAYIRAKMGQPGTTTFYWHYNPYELLHYALGGDQLPDRAATALFKCTISKDLKALFVVERQKVFLGPQASVN